MSRGRKRTSRSNPVGKTTGERARSLRKLGWKDKEIQTLPSTTKKFYVKYGIKPKPFTIKQRVLNTGVFRIAGEPTKNVEEYKEKVLTTRINRFNEPLKKGGVRNVRYLPVSEKDTDISRLRQKKAASKVGGPKLTKAETIYLRKLQEWNAGDGRKDDLKRESVLFPLRKIGRSALGAVKQGIAKREERNKLTAERSEQFRESIASDASKVGGVGKDVVGSSLRAEKRAIRQIPGGERAMRTLGIDTSDVPKFGREFRRARDLDRRKGRKEKKFNKRDFKDESSEKEEMETEVRKPRYVF